MPEPDTLATDTQPNLILASRVLNKPVYTLDGDHLGHVDDISIDRVSGQSIYGIMSFGGFFGIGERYHPLPWSVLTYSPNTGGFVIGMTKEQLQSAPNYIRDDLERLGGARHHQSDVDVAMFYRV